MSLDDHERMINFATAKLLVLSTFTIISIVGQTVLYVSKLMERNYLHLNV